MSNHIYVRFGNYVLRNPFKVQFMKSTLLTDVFNQFVADRIYANSHMLILFVVLHGNMSIKRIKLTEQGYNAIFKVKFLFIPIIII